MPGSEPSPDLLISPAEVRGLLDRGEPLVVLDARGRAAYARAAERVAGDRRVPERDAFAAWAAGLPRGAWLLAYCT